MSESKHSTLPSKRHIICDDAQLWLKKQKSLPNVITGICDLDEINMNMPQYLDFFTNIARMIFEKIDPKGYVIFIQTDRKYNRSWIDKSYILSSLADSYGLKMIWHKIVLLRGVDRTDLHRPTYAHMLCYSVEGTTGSATPDVIPVSKRIYKNATPVAAALRAVEFVRKYSNSNTVIDPFVGRGTIPAIANMVGLDAVGVDIDQKQCQEAKALNITRDMISYYL